jgi:hypothetical protein
MTTKLVRFIATLAIIISIVGNTRVAHAANGASLSGNSQNIEPPRAPQLQHLDIPALTIPPASSLGVQFVHVATAANITLNWTTIDNPLTNGNPNAIILVTPNWNPGSVGGTYNNHPIGVWYDGSKWAIFNQDIAAMPANAAFNVLVPNPDTSVFVHVATAANITLNWTTIDNPLTNGNPNAIVVVTPNYNPGGVGGIYDNHNIGVWYDGSKWAIFNQDIAAMPVNASFNVSILTAGAGVFVHTATAGNSAGDYTTIDNPLTNGNPNAIVFVTPNYNPGGVGGIYDKHSIGVWYDGSKWAIFNQDTTAMPVNASFNVLLLVPSSDIFVHTASAGNSAGDYTRIDNAITNGHPNAIVFTTPNWNPGGLGGTYNNHNTGVWYDITTDQWAIFNQDVTTIPAHAAFNVLIPNPDTSVFIHKATAANIAGNVTTIDYPLTNGNPNAIILVTPNYNPGNVGGTYDNHPIGLFYNGSKWAIFNQDIAAMPVNASFNVFVPTAGPGVGVFIHTASTLNTGGNVTAIDNALTNHNPNAIVLVTPNWNPGGVGGTYDNHPIGVYYDGSKWAIFNQDIAGMPIGAAFNVYVFANYKIYLPLIIR